jgi:hypothetical protein
MSSYAELFSAYGGTAYLDRIEAAGFNRLPAPYLNGSMWSMQYFHKTNAIGGCNAYGLPFECCVANGNQGCESARQALHAETGERGGWAFTAQAVLCCAAR